MNVLSLFDGIACGRVALERAGIKVDKYYASEIDKYAIKIAKANYPDIIELGDVNNFEEWDLSQIDLLIGGSPCQDLSIAKQDRKGLDGERSGLFWRYVDCLRKFKPKYFLLENVASMPKEAKETITKTLGVEPIMINSALVSAQQRKRLYWTNIPNVDLPDDKGIVLKDILLNATDGIEFPCDVEKQGKEIKKISPEKSQSLLARDYKGFGNQTMTGVLEPIRIPKYGVEDKSRSLTSHYANNCGGWIDRINDPNPAKQQVDLIAEPKMDTQKSIYVGEIKNNGYKNGKQSSMEYRIYSVKGRSLSLNGFQTNYKIDLPDGDYIIRKLYPLECERLQTLPDNYTLCSGVSNTQRYKCLGNGWTVDVIAWIFSFIPNK